MEEMTRLTRLVKSKVEFRKFLDENLFPLGLIHEASAWFDHEIECAMDAEKWRKKLVESSDLR